MVSYICMAAKWSCIQLVDLGLCSRKYFLVDIMIFNYTVEGVIHIILEMSGIDNICVVSPLASHNLETQSLPR